MDAVISIGLICTILLVSGFVIGLADRANFAPRWLLASAVLVFLNDALLTNFYGNIPSFLPNSDWNWQGKLLAMAVSLAIAFHPAIGWKQIGLTLMQKREGLIGTLVIAVTYCLFFVAIASMFPNDPVRADALAFQLTMPGLEEEIFYRGLLLFMLHEAFRGRIRMAGVNWGWSAFLTSALFGLAHAFSYDSAEGISFDASIMAMTFIPSFLGVWIRERSGSLLLPILVHNFGNSIFFFV
ncbi:MAG: CPBP family intramembrane metalloprotease [Alphaproteobacteria bacterium HGW-Alphaproteobacteria-9]|nr:MAG: CPBP family intramembrane metalloprotease [Alphaproteobacteria bacterium HGW-Alphaproteobacteria-9]